MNRMFLTLTGAALLGACVPTGYHHRKTAERRAAEMHNQAQKTENASYSSYGNFPFDDGQDLATNNYEAPMGGTVEYGYVEVPAVPMDLAPVFFDVDSAELSRLAKATLKAGAMRLKDGHSCVEWVECRAKHPERAIDLRIEAHADARGTEAYNLALAQRRAEAVRKFLAEQGVPARTMTTVSMGEGHPQATGNDERSWARNRRVDLIATPSETIQEAPAVSFLSR